MVTHPTAIHLCSGYGGFELGLRPWGVRTVAHVERDSYAAAILMERMGEARLDQAPIWDDLTTFDGEPWRGRVDILTAGFPCQPFSNAGTRRGLDDDRWLWPAIARIVAQVRPSFVMLENVPPVVRAGLPAVLQDLAQIGFDAEWGMYSAADVGAPHRRQRFWLLAHTASSDAGSGFRARNSRRDADRSSGWAEPFAAESMDDANSASFPIVRSGREQEKSVAFPPSRDDHEGWERWINQGGPQPVVCRNTNGPPTGLAHALHLGGNGLVPQAATEAIRQLLDRSGWNLTQ